MTDNKEVRDLVLAILFGLVGGLIGSTPILIGRFFRREPLFVGRKAEKLTSPRILYAGIALFGAVAISSFAGGLPLFAGFFSLIASLYCIGLIAYRYGWRG